MRGFRFRPAADEAPRRTREKNLWYPGYPQVHGVFENGSQGEDIWKRRFLPYSWTDENGSVRIQLAGVASVSIRFRSKEPEFRNQ